MTTQPTFTKLQLVEDGSLSSGIEANHQDTHLFLAELYTWGEEREQI
jgi:hypothetical protein